jgi:hypothetical protein
MYYAINAVFQLIPNLVHPKPLNVPTQLDEALVAQLIPQTQLACPTAVVALPVDLHGKLSAICEKRKVEVILFHAVLRNRA